MKITKAEVFVASPSRNFVTLKIYTDVGIYGVGDATLNGRELAVSSYLKDHLLPVLVGQNPLNTEDIWQYMYRGSYWRNGPVTMTAIAAVDMCLWDIKGKFLNTPVYNLLGGKSREGILVYIHSHGNTIDEAIQDFGKYIEKGYRAIRTQSGIPGIKKIYGVSESEKNYEPAQKGLPVGEIWETKKYLNYIPNLFKEIRDTFGDDVEILHDAHHRLKPIEAARLGKEVEPFRLFWIEDPISPEFQDGYRIIRNHTVTPLAEGEILNSYWDVNDLITEHLIDYLRISITHGGGITNLKKIAAICEMYNVSTGFHGATDLSPITMSAALHFNYAINNFGIQEYMPHSNLTNEVFPHSYYFEDGFMKIRDNPGLGVDYDEELAKKYPYQQASLPFNRNYDGTIINW